MIQRDDYLHRLNTAIGRSPITALLGPRQCGKTTLARQLAGQHSSTFFDIESIPDRRTLLGHPKVGASWEGFAIEQSLQILRPNAAYFWGTHAGAEIDLVFQRKVR